MPSTNAAFPRSARSMMSPPGWGQSRTRLPFSSSTPFTTTLCSCGLSSCCRKKSSTLRPQHPDVPEGPAQLHELLRREGLASLQDLPPPRVGGAHLFFLLVREVENVQDEHLVDLGPVEEIPRALRGDLGVVVEDYRGGEHRAQLPLLPDEHRPRLQVLAPFRGLPQLLRRVDQRDELSSLHPQRRVGRDEGLPERALPILASPRGRVGYPDRYPEDAPLQRFGSYLHRSVQRAPHAHQSPHDLSCGPPQRFLPAPLGDVYPYPLGRLQLGELEPPDRYLSLGRLIPRQVELSSDPQFIHEFQGLAALSGDLPLGDVQEANLHLDGGLSVARHQALGLHDPGVILAPGLAVSPRVHPAEGPALLILSRRPAIRPQQVSFVEHRLGDLLRRVHLPIHLLLARTQQRLYGVLPGREPPANLVVVELIEGVSAQPDPGAIGEVVVHHLPPQPDRQPELRLFLPGDPGSL